MLCLFTGILLITACNPASDKQSAAIELPNQDATGMAAPENVQIDPEYFVADTIASAHGLEPTKNDAVSGKTESVDWDKKLIKTADLSIELKDYAAFNNTTHNRLKAYGAYIAEEHQSQSDYKMANEIIIKVPVNQFDNLLNNLPGEGIKIVEKNIASQDVTAEVMDTKARLEAKKQVRLKYLDLLKQAKNMSEILEVQNEINQIQEQIESGTGRIYFLQHQSAYSTINLKYFQYLTPNGADEDHPDFFSRLSKAFKTGGSLILDLFLFLVSIWPLLIFACAGFIILKKLRIKKA